MFLNAQSIETFLKTNGCGKKAQIGYDLTLKTVRKVTGGSIINSVAKILPYEDVAIATDNRYYLPKGIYSVTFEQGCTLSEDVAAFIVHRSSIARIGCKIYSAIYDPGFFTDEMGAFLEVLIDGVIVEKGSRVAQIVMFKTEKANKYEGRYLNTGDVK